MQLCCLSSLEESETEGCDKIAIAKICEFADNAGANSGDDEKGEIDMGQMTEIERLEAKLKGLKMVDGTGLKWWEVMRVEGALLHFEPQLKAPREAYTFALGVVEGKPVWPGDTLYIHGGFIFLPVAGLPLPSGLSWAPPKPKTVMVELPVEVAKSYAARVERYTKVRHDSAQIAEACRKALEAQ